MGRSGHQQLWDSGRVRTKCARHGCKVRIAPTHALLCAIFGLRRLFCDAHDKRILSERTTYRECYSCGREVEARSLKRIKLGDGEVMRVCRDSRDCLHALGGW